MDKILVVDDENSIRRLFEDTFATTNYHVISAAGADEALTLLTENHIDIIFLDLKLFGINGIELCRRIRETKPVSIIYAMTGWPGLFEISECREAGFDDYLIKPISELTLLKAAEDAKEKITRWINTC